MATPKKTPVSSNAVSEKPTPAEAREAAIEAQLDAQSAQKAKDTAPAVEAKPGPKPDDGRVADAPRKRGRPPGGGGAGSSSGEKKANPRDFYIDLGSLPPSFLSYLCHTPQDMVLGLVTVWTGDNPNKAGTGPKGQHVPPLMPGQFLDPDLRKIEEEAFQAWTKMLGMKLHPGAVWLLASSMNATAALSLAVAARALAMRGIDIDPRKFMEAMAALRAQANGAPAPAPAGETPPAPPKDVTPAAVTIVPGVSPNGTDAPAHPPSSGGGQAHSS